MTTPDQALLHELAAVERLQILAGDSEAGPLLRREYHLRHAAAVDRYAQIPTGDGVRHRAEELAGRLLEFDRVERTGRGPESCDDPRWDGVPRAYVRQEHAAAAREGRLTSQIDEWMLSVDLGWDDSGWTDTGVDGVQVQALSSSDVAAEALGGWVGIRTREGTRAVLLMTVRDVAASRGTGSAVRPVSRSLARSVLDTLGEKP
ncbi:hypothetical protein ACFY2W_36335 [Streptomyces sp. NPDC001262]|uniref:hypothetical protein n=1 Tax=Streptomyces sp. NPDC001262 TaxID=3364552 RepID=UPI0036C99DE7